MLEPVDNGSHEVVDFVCTEADDAASIIMGLPRAELVGARLTGLHPAALGKESLGRLQTVMASGEPFEAADLASPLASVDGSVTSYDVRASRVAGKVQVTWTEVIERSTEHRTLAQREQYYKLLARNASDVVFRGTNDGVVEWVSDSVKEILGWAPEDLIGQPIAEFVDPSCRAELVRIQDDLAAGLRTRGELLVRAADEEARWMAVTMSPLVSADGRVSGRVGSWRDIGAEVANRAKLEAVSRAFAALAEGNRVVLRARDELELVAQMCRTVAEIGTYAFAWYGVPVQDADRSVRIVAVGGDDHGYVKDLRVSWGDGPLAQGPSGRCFRSRTSQVSNKLSDDAGFSPWRSAADERGIQSSIALPVIVDGDMHGSLTVYAYQADAFDAQAQDLLESLASNIGYGIARLRAAAELEVSERRYRQVVENASDIVYTTDQRGRITWIAPTVSATLGWTPDEVVGTGITEWIHPDDRTGGEAADGGHDGKAAGAEGVASSGQRLVRLLSKDGTYRWMSARTVPQIDASGRTIGRLGAMRDVDELVRAQQAAQGTARRLQATLDSFMDPHVVLTAVRNENQEITDFVYTDANEAACAYNHVTSAQLLGTRLLDLLPGHVESGLLAMYAAVIDTGQPLVLDDFRYPHEILAEERYFDMRAVKIGEGVSFTWRDVTERRLAEVALAESERYFRLLAENASDVVLISNRSRVCEWVSPSVTALTGWSVQDVIGHSVTEFLHAGDVQSLDRRYAAEGRTAHVSERVRFRCADGSHRWMSAAVNPMVG